MAKKPQPLALETKLPYIEYCTLEQAAELLSAPLWMIDHYIEIGAVHPVVQLNRRVDSENITTIDANGHVAVPDANTLEKANECRYSKIRSIGDGEYLLSGLWKIINLVIIKDILSCREPGQRAVGLSSLVRFSPVDVKGEVFVSNLCTYTVFDDQITRSDLLLLRDDLLAIEGAIEKHQPISNIYNDKKLSKEHTKQLAANQAGAVRTTPKRLCCVIRTENQVVRN
ncbi:hypothetical protein [Vibrio alginolyticus]